jgi:hypothetical protein
MESLHQLEEWHTRIRTQHHAHVRSAADFERHGVVLGVVVVILTTVVGTSIFAGLETTTPWKIVTGLLSMAAAVLSSVQTVLKYPELAQLHKNAALKYGKLRRELEAQCAAGFEDHSTLVEFLMRFKEGWDMAQAESPSIPQRLYDKSRQAVAAEPSPLQPTSPTA